MSLPSEREAPAGTVPYSKSRPDYCIPFITRLDEGPRLQVSGEKLLISRGLFIQIGWQKLN